jgi:hypothetical protein
MQGLYWMELTPFSPAVGGKAPELVYFWLHAFPLHALNCGPPATDLPRVPDIGTMQSIPFQQFRRFCGLVVKTVAVGCVIIISLP